MTLAAVCWAFSHPAASPAERLTLICLGDRTDEFGLAIVDLESLADSAVCDAIALADLLVELQRRDVLRFMPHLNGLYEEMAGLAQSDQRVVIFLCAFDERKHLRPGEEHPIYGEVVLP
ncbi:MAG: hypothetical protein INF92_16635 [Rhodobacter sp.]|nr:hypothetical protein [Rhodobacter sp.]